MSYWNNRLCRDIAPNGDVFYSVREVFYDDDDKPVGWTQDPITAVTESPEDTIHMLRMQLDDCLNRPVLDLVGLEPEPRPRATATGQGWTMDEILEQQDALADKFEAALPRTEPQPEN